MVRIYNSSLEVACRMAKVLVAIYPSSLSLERLICFDFILVNLKDFLPEEISLHPPIPRRDAQLALKREIVLESLALLQGYELASKIYTHRGFVYKASEKTYAFTNSLHNEYVAQMEHNINLVVKLYSDIPDEQLQSIIKNQIANIYEELKAQLIYPEYDQVIVSRELEKVEQDIESSKDILKGIVDALDDKKQLLKELSDELYSISDREKYLSLLIERFSLLKDQYFIDLQRIDVVSQANFYLNNFADIYCEFCNTPQKKENEISYDDCFLSCNAEKLKIKSQLKGLIESIGSNVREHELIMLRKNDVNEIYQSEKSDFKTLEDKNIKQYIHLLNHFMNIKTIF